MPATSLGALQRKKANMAKGTNSSSSDCSCSRDSSTQRSGETQKIAPWIEKPSTGSNSTTNSLGPHKHDCAGTIDPEALCKDSGQVRLEELGYKQELRREFGLLTSVAVGCSVMSFLLGITGESQACAPLRSIHIHHFGCQIQSTVGECSLGTHTAHRQMVLG